jgi:ACS family hexuronate transporter-like MFS transporter
MIGACHFPTTQETLPEASHPDDGAPAGFYRWVICALLFAATTINYMDRQVLGVLAPLLQKQIGWSELQYGHMVAAFQAAYAVGLLGFGYLIDRWGVKRGYSLAILIWSIAAALHAAARNVAAFTGARVMLGLGECGNFPSAIKAVAEWFVPSERALATGIFNSGSTIGAIVAPVLVPWIALRFGWQAAFLSLGAAGFVWLVFWLSLYRSPPSDSWSPRPSVRASPSALRSWLHVFQLLRFRQTWAFIVVSIVGQPVGWFFLYWLPKFFGSRYGLSISQAGWPLVIVYSMALLGGIGGGILPAVLLARRCSLNQSRKISLALCAALMIPVAFATLARSVWLATVLIGLGLAALQGWAANCYSVVSDLLAKPAIASVVALGTFAGSATAIAYAEFAGRVLEKSNNYFVLFVIAGLACPVGVIVLHLLVPRWNAVVPSGFSADV